MKLNKKKLFSLSLVIVLIAILSFGTLAWFNDSKSVTNTFYVASDDSDGDGKVDAEEIFSVDVWEYVDADGDGNYDDTDGDGTPDQNDKGALIGPIYPGVTIKKAPHVENTGSYDQYIRVVITFKSDDNWHILKTSQFNNPMGLLNLDKCWVNGGSIKVDGASAYYFYLDGVLKPDDEVLVFSTVSIPTSLDQADFARMVGETTLTVRVDAIQADNMGSSAKEAFEEIAKWAPGADYAYPTT